jgi:predicted NAD/FAD-binding protein
MKLAIVGSGISGLTAGHLLHRIHDVTLFECHPRLGGHTHTHDVPEGDLVRKIDTGFIVCNDWTYPNFLKLMKSVGVELRASEMSFSVRNFATGLEWAGGNVDTLFCQRSNLLRFKFLKMVSEILRFNKEAAALADDHGPGERPLGAWLDENGYSKFFQQHYVLPMGGAIWSTSAKVMRDFPAKFFARFFKNHGMLNVSDRPTWRTVVGGSSAYIPKLTEGWSDRIRLDSPVCQVRRELDGVWITVVGREAERFDGVVLASHADETLGMLVDASEAERAILGALPYQPNEAILHTDASIMPKRRKAWAAWNFHVLPDGKDDQQLAVTYWMNRLQGIESETEYLVTLNHAERIDPSKIIKRLSYHHPLFSSASSAAQLRKGEIQGHRNTWYAGAYWSWGFHEDGCKSGVEVARLLGGELA